MSSSHGRSAAIGRAHLNGSRGHSLTMPQTLTEKLDQELGPQSGDLLHLFPAGQSRGSAAAISGSSDLSATNSPQASGPHDFYLDAEDGEEPMPIPSTWTRTPDRTETRGLARQVRAGLMGLAVGLALVVPAALWAAGRLDVEVAGVRPFAFLGASDDQPVTSHAAAAGMTTRELVPAPRPVERTALPAASEQSGSGSAIGTADELIERAHGFITDGNMLRAREILSDSALADNPRAAFALAETYDPNILAATGAQDARAEVERARMLYRKALAGGVVAAKRRLDALN